MQNNPNQNTKTNGKKNHPKNIQIIDTNSLNKPNKKKKIQITNKCRTQELVVIRLID